MQIISTCTVQREGSGKIGEAMRGSSLEPGCRYMKALSSVLYNEPAAPVGCWGVGVVGGARSMMGLLHGTYYLCVPYAQCSDHVM